MLLGALVLAVVGCGQDVCDRASPCPKDPVKTQAVKDACKVSEAAAKGSPCYAETVAYANCYLDSLVCGADGTTDPTASSARRTSDCGTLGTRLTTCCSGNQTSAACK